MKLELTTAECLNLYDVLTCVLRLRSKEAWVRQRDIDVCASVVKQLEDKVLDALMYQQANAENTEKFAMWLKNEDKKIREIREQQRDKKCVIEKTKNESVVALSDLQEDSLDGSREYPKRSSPRMPHPGRRGKFAGYKY